MSLILALCALALLCWAVRLARLHVVLNKQRQVINASHAALVAWQSQLDDCNQTMVQQSNATAELIEQTQVAQEQAMLDFGRKMATAIGEIDEASGKRVLAITVDHVSSITTARMLSAMQRRREGAPA